MSLFVTAVNFFCEILIYLIIARAIMSWFSRPGDRSYGIFRFLCQLTEPILSPCRKITSRFTGGAGMDFSPVIAIFLIWLVQWLLVRVLSILT
ncbi:MAG: YggT family protein [Bacillota bacterium]|nr:YggT family protein [Bacillota bacterium]